MMSDNTRHFAFGILPVVIAAVLLAWIELRPQPTESYSVNWRFYLSVPGFEDELVRLVAQNRAPILNDLVDRRRIRAVRFYKQDPSSVGRTNWTAAVAVEYLTSAGAPPAPTDEDITRLFPDRKRHTDDTTRERRLIDSEWQYTVQQVLPKK